MLHKRDKVYIIYYRVSTARLERQPSLHSVHLSTRGSPATAATVLVPISQHRPAQFPSAYASISSSICYGARSFTRLPIYSGTQHLDRSGSFAGCSDMSNSPGSCPTSNCEPTSIHILNRNPRSLWYFPLAKADALHAQRNFLSLF